MRLECNECAAGDHAECAQRGHMREITCQCDCPTATQARKMLRIEPPASRLDMRTDVPPPPYLIADLWMALGNEPGHEFDDQIALRGEVDLWAYLLQSVRDAHAEVDALRRWQGARITSDEYATAVVKENGDPLYVRAKAALESLHEVRTVTVDVARDEEIRNARGELVRGTLEATITIIGRVQ